MTALSQTHRERLSKLLAMLDTDYANERDNAGLAAHRLIRERGLTWPEVLCPAPRTKAHEIHIANWRAVVAACLRRDDELTDFDRGFLRSLARFPYLSVKQMAVLRRIAADLDLCEAA